ncbi:MAG: 5-(carboxyamino)imidazole ribonucleotide synthase [Planctomycetales bacterium]|nr:5-(carboxyamino)imidazole ribonucleotide synthase [Planctomycetales bacterium]
MLPGETIGIIGGGQLGRMLALAAKQMGYRIKVVTDEADSPGTQVADDTLVCDLKDPSVLPEFLSNVSVVTYETENLSYEFVAAAHQFARVRPGLDLLKMSQHRLREKSGLKKMGLPVGDFAAIRHAHDLESAAERFGYQAVLKTVTGGYDGKGQWLLTDANDLPKILSETKSLFAANNASSEEAKLILEEFVTFTAEFSVIAARSTNGHIETYGPILNEHRNHILDLSVCPANFDDRLTEEAIQIARSLASQMDVVGLFCIEFFLTADNRILINEIAPRPHNSGHLTIEGHVTSQFAQQMRSICGLPLGSTQMLRPFAAMSNLLGDVWSGGQPNWAQALATRNAYVHLYGKAEARLGRKMGHLTVIGETSEEVTQSALSCREMLLVRS